MDFWTLANAVASGLLIGLVYGLSALGLSVIFGVIRIVNFAHGEIMVMGMFFALLMFRWLGLDPLLSVPLAAALMFGFGYVLQLVVVSRVSHLPEHMQFLLLAAIAIMIVSALLLIFGPDAQGVEVDYAWDSFAVGELIIDYPKMFAAIGAVIVASLLLAFFKYTATGKAIRACADNRMGAQVVGLNVSRLYALTFGIGAACLGAAGAIILLLFEVHPYLAPGYTLLAFVIVIIGGLGSLFGALVGGILIGVSEALAAVLFQPSMKTAFSFGLLILILLLRPQGLLGKAVR
ncbi:MAG: branched-chain amino acid ABC transporter permease [Rhodospirillaceae bacterium]|nr:branched-chain amino acid ABC transporter permease [Rhodospirillaceae bacterium]MDE0254047.1 branched-chain amino acid ABC transporter permease [Rhodospirillaceae bacterium]MDE0616078.1 branched-chain amino acid ABC transporter permease [Rhodospirillaceae bacterium]MXY41694.1 branched-chain amino acid ABC transporter permease [Rhodospirillaceae bacterium]MYF08529.1 branched-chain amino acid ABC transporter permease [Rhodospirillaceae bacterium]